METSDRVRMAIENIGTAYRLTPREVRVLHAVMEVDGVRQIAAVLSISPTTVKTHLRHIFDKTGAKRQIDLIRLVAHAAIASEIGSSSSRAPPSS